MRSAGVLLHISSLYNEDGIGTLGDEAYQFVDFLASSKQKFWQVLPLNPTSYGDSPYQSFSCMAYNPYFISIDYLIRDGLLEKKDKVFLGPGVNYKKLFDKKIKVLKKAYNNKKIVQEDFDLFKAKNKRWLDDYALFSVLKEKNNYLPWYQWSDDYKFYNKSRMALYMNEHQTELDIYCFIQYLFVKQYSNLKKYAHKKKIKIIGDLPIYVAYDSVDVWKNTKMFLLDEKLEMTAVAGCPPDEFAIDGQLWGNPLYDWEYLKESNFKWWINRIRQAKKMFDVIRIDHFRGFAGYYSIPNGKKAKDGCWKKGINKVLFDEINKKLPNTFIIAENLGFLTKDVFKLLDETKYPGMHVAQFEFGKGLPFAKDYDENSIIYTGTHDNMSIRKWIEDSPEKERILSLCPSYYKEDYLNVIYETLLKKPFLAIVPFADYVGSLARMNEPSTLNNNWLYQIDKNDLNDDLKKLILEMTTKSNRL